MDIRKCPKPNPSSAGWHWRFRSLAKRRLLPTALLVLGLALAPGAVCFGTGAATVTILQTTDIHSCCGDDPDGHDWRRLASVITRERQRAGGRACSLLIDCGDTIQGTWAAAATRGAVGLRLLNALRYDVWVPGNHEFDFGVPRLAELIARSRPVVLQGNVRLPVGPPLPGFRIFERAGARVAVIGLNASALKSWLWGHAVEGYQVEDAEDALAALMPEVRRAAPAAIVLALHQGWRYHEDRPINEVRRLAQCFPDIDLILGGHTHHTVPGRRLGGTWYVQAGALADSVAVVELTLDKRRQRVLDIRSRLVSGDGEPMAPVAAAAVAELLAEAARVGARPVCVPARAVDTAGLPGRDCGMSEVICRAIAAATGADVVLHGVLGESSWQAGSPVTESMLFAAVPYENAVGLADLTLGDLTTVLDEQLQQAGSRAFCGPWGIEVKVAPDRRHVAGLRPRAEPDAEGRYTVAFNSYTIAGAGKRFPALAAAVRQPTARLRQAAASTRDALRDYLRHAPRWDAPATRWLAPTDGTAAASP